jgi:hypothetical protein
MDGVRGYAERVVRRVRSDAAAHRNGARILVAVAISDVAYRLLMREPLRRALGVETRRA